MKTKSTLFINLLWVLFIVSLVSLIIDNQSAITDYVERIFNPPCTSTLTYSLGNIDSKFKITNSNLISDLESASEVWNKLSNKPLLKYDENSSFKINLIYDYRQEATDKLKAIGLVIKDDESTYNSLKLKYDSLLKTYNQNKATLEKDMNNLEIAKSDYESKVRYWNSEGGAPKSEYESLNRERNQINVQISILNSKSASLKDQADTINSIATVINHLIDHLNLNVNKYNTTNQATAEEFNEGEYVVSQNKKEIDIYQFDSSSSLMRVLTHELGHALGLSHVEGSDSIMYKINKGTTLTPSKNDANELARVCKIKL